MTQHDYDPTFRLTRRHPRIRGPVPAPGETLLDQIVPPFPPAEDKSLEGRFQAWLAEHEDVYQMIVRMARDARDAGRTRVSMKMLWEAVRWQMFIQKDGAEYALNNSWTSRMVRVIEEREPDLVGLFAKRALRAKAD